METTVNVNGRVLKDALNLNMIYFVGYKTEKKGEFSYENTNFITLVYVESGNFSIKYQGMNFSVGENELFFIPPSTKFTVNVISSKTRIFTCLFSLASRIPLDIFDKKYFASGIKLPLLKRLTRSAAYVFPDKFAENISPKAEPIAEHLLKSCLELLMIECIKPSDKSIIDSNYPISGKGQSAKTATAVYEYLTQNTHRNLTLEEIAEELFFSVSYVKTAFKKHTGKSVMTAFSELKIKRAKKLIKKGIHFSDVAKQLGFSSEQYFSKVFSKIAGLTPTEYKKSLIK